MARTFGLLRVGTVLALIVLPVVAAAPAGASPSAEAAPPAAAVPGTPLPPGWEQCILQGTGAPVTPDNVADLDEWQVAEGGSTNNAAAFNPFNTGQMSDVNGAALPVTATPGGFPAFASWAAGCAATVATLEKPEMAPIVTALDAGDVSPPGLFLAAVDQSSWCAPSSDGVPCYAGAILAGELLRALLSGRSVQLNAVLTSYSDTGGDLHIYEKTAYVTAVEDGQLAERDAELDVAEQALSGARATRQSATEALRRMALHDYTTGAVMAFNSGLGIVANPNGEGVEAGFFRSVAIGQAVLRLDQATAAYDAASAKDQLSQSAVDQATATANAASSAQGQALQALEADVKGLEGSLSCPAPTVATTATPATGTDNAGQLWQELQSCLAPSSPPLTLAGGSAPS